MPHRCRIPRVKEHPWIMAEFQETFLNFINFFIHCYIRAGAYAIISSFMSFFPVTPNKTNIKINKESL